MRLLTETLGVLVAAVLLAHFALPWAGRARYALACLFVAVAVSVPLAFGSMNVQIRTLDANHKASVDARKQGHLTQDAIDDIVGQRTGVNTGFTDFVRANLPRRSSYYLAVTPGPEAGGVTHWITWRLLPHLPTGIEGQRGDGIVNPPDPKTAAKADYVVFYGLEPRRWLLRNRVKVTHLRRFAPKYWIGRRAG